MNKVLEFFIKAKDLSSEVIERIVGKIQSWRDAATAAAKATSAASKSSAQSMSAVNTAMKQTSVNWDAIAKAEEDAARRKKEIAKLERELKVATLEAGKANGQAAEMAQQRVDLIQKGIKQLQQSATQDFNLMELGQNALMGNMEGMAKQVVQLAAKFKILGMSMASLSVYGLVIMAIVKLFTWWRDSVKECEEKIRTIKMDGLTTQLGILDKALKTVNDRMAEQIKLLDETTKHQNALTDASANRQKALNEQARERELAGTTDADERDRINRKWDSENASIDVSARKQKFERELDAERDKLEEVEKAIADNEMLQRERIAEKDREVAERDEIWNDTLDKEDEDWKAANERVKKAQEAVAAGKAKIKELYEQRSNLKNGIVEREAGAGAADEQDRADAMRRAREAADAEKAVAEAKAAEAERNADELDDIWREWYNTYCDWQKDKDSEVLAAKAKLMQEYYDAMEAASTDKEREEIRAEKARWERELAFQKQFEDEKRAADKAAEDERAAREKANRKQQLAQDIEDTKTRLAASTEAQSAAQARVSAAKAAVSQAWGWYKDKGAMENYRKQADADVAAKAQYEKDYKHLLAGHNADRLSEALYLSRRGDTDKLEEQMAKWRKGAFGLSVEDEATMRVAVAQDEEKRANQALLDISDNTANIKAILDVLQGGGEQE